MTRMKRNNFSFSPDVLALNPGLVEQAIVKGAKYGNVKQVIDGITFDSKAEAARYQELVLLERAGQITDLTPTSESGKIRFAIGGGRFYTPDFCYLENGRMIAEDVKGGTATITEASSLRMALFRERYPDIELRIVRR